MKTIQSEAQSYPFFSLFPANEQIEIRDWRKNTALPRGCVYVSGTHVKGDWGLRGGKSLNKIACFLEAYNLKHIRYATKNKSPACSGSHTDPKFHEPKDWTYLKTINGEVSARHGKKTGNYFFSAFDGDFFNKPGSNKLEAWRSERLMKNFQKMVLYLDIMAARTDNGTRIVVNTCCLMPNMELRHVSKFGKDKNVGEIRGNNLYSVMDKTTYGWHTEGKLATRYKCMPNGKTCIDQFRDVLAKFFFITIIKGEGKIIEKAVINDLLTKEKKLSKNLSQDEQQLFTVPIKVLGVKNLIHKSAFCFEPYQIFYEDQYSHKTRFFTLNTYYKSQERMLNIFKTGSIHTVRLRQTQPLTFFNCYVNSA